MRERVNYLGGEITIHAVVGQGTRIEVWIPTAQKPESAKPLQAKTAATGIETAGAA